MKCKISIITVSYNSAVTIIDTLESVLNQTVAPFEYIIIDGNSTDGTQDILAKYEPIFLAKQISFHWVSAKDLGIYDAMNKGINMAQGDIVGIINSDDWYLAQALGFITEVYDEKFGIYYGDIVKYINHENSFIKKSRHCSTLLKCMEIAHPSCFVKKEIYNKIGLFNLNYAIAADYEFLLRAYKNKVSFYHTHKIIAYMRATGVSSQQYIRGWQEEIQISISSGTSPWLAKMRYYEKYFKRKLINLTKWLGLRAH